MYHVLIVDDESIIRASIHSLLDRMEAPLLGEIRSCASAEEALLICEAFSPDIVITDIVMGDLNGIEMLAKLRGSLPHCRFLVISGYDDFSFVRSAFKEGAADYLLKPILYPSFKAVIDKLLMELNQRQADVLNASFGSMLLDVYRYHFSYESAAAFFAVPENTRVQATVLGFPFLPDGSMKRRITDTLACTALSPLLVPGYLIDDTYYMLFGCHGTLPDAPEKLLYNAINSFPPSQRPAAALGLPQDARHFARQFDLTRKILDNRLIHGYGRLYTSADIQNGDTQAVTAALTAILNRLLPENVQEIKRQIHQLLLGSDARTLRKSYELVNSLSRIKALQEADGTPEHASSSFHSFLTRQEVQNKLDELVDLMAGAMKDRYVNLIGQVKQYIEENYSRKLMLSEISEHFAVSYAHMSHVISKSLGTSFSEYVTAVRMRHALELLHDPMRTIQEISAMAGFDNPFTFSRAFKKYFGVSPNNFRKAPVKTE